MNVVHDASLIDDEMKKGYSAPFYDDRIFPALTRMIRDREGDLSSTELQKSKHLSYSFGVKRPRRPCTCRSSSTQRFTEFKIYFLRKYRTFTT